MIIRDRIFKFEKSTKSGKLYERPLRPIGNKSEEDYASDYSSDESEYYYVESEEERTRRRIRYIWWIAFPLVFILYHIYKCERDTEREKAFQELMKPMDQKSTNFNPQEHIRVDSNLNIKVDKEYIGHLKKKFGKVR